MIDNNIYLYYSLNKSKKSTRQYKSGTKSISIIKIPEHISLQIKFNKFEQGFVYPVDYMYVVQKKYDINTYNFVYKLLFPCPNLKVAVCNIENENEVLRNICIAIIKFKTFKRKFDNLVDPDRSKVFCVAAPV